jgi:hypothetical protein
MSEDSDSPKLSGIVQGATELAKAIPIYQDAFQPMMQETGKALSVVGRAVNVAISPIRGLVWGAERVENWLATKVAEKLATTPEEDIVTPDLSVAGPLIEALKFNGHKPELSEMYAALLAGAMRKSSQLLAHPTFVMKIQSMTTLDARIFNIISSRYAVPTIDIAVQDEKSIGRLPIADFFNPVFQATGLSLGLSENSVLGMIQSSIENIEGLGLVQAVKNGFLTSEENTKEYQSIEEGFLCTAFREMSKTSGRNYTFQKSFVRTTQIGKNFRSVTSL